MSKNTLLYGSAKDAAELLEVIEFDKGEGVQDLQMALINALGRIDTLERQVKALRKDLND